MILFETVNTLQKVRAKITGRKIKAPSSFASKGERCVAGVLAKHGIEYKPQHPLGYMHVDFAVVHQGKLFFYRIRWTSALSSCTSLWRTQGVCGAKSPGYA